MSLLEHKTPVRGRDRSRVRDLLEKKPTKIIVRERFVQESHF